MTYLTFLQKDGLVNFHDIGAPALRGYIIKGGWPSNTATIIDRKTGIRYTVDSFFHKNGELPEIVALDFWMTGWKPPKLPNEVER